MPRAADTAAGGIPSKPVRRSHRTYRSHSLPAIGSRPGPTATHSHSSSLPSSPIQTPTRVIRLSFLDAMRSGPSCTPLPDPFSETEPIAPGSRFAYVHRVMELAMEETKAMLLNEMQIGCGQYIDSEDTFLAATDVLPYCPQAACGLGDRWSMLYFKSFRELKRHTELVHPEIETTYQPLKAEYHALLRMLGF